MNYSVLLAALAVFAGSVLAAPADDLKEAQRLYGQGKLAPALEKVDAYLSAEPRDPQGRFLRGLVLTEQKKSADAIQVFTRLTEDFPELAEPYNNLAVLYAAQGNYERALQLDRNNASAKTKSAKVKELFDAQRVNP